MTQAWQSKKEQAVELRRLDKAREGLLATPRALRRIPASSLLPLSLQLVFPRKNNVDLLC